MFLTWSCFIVLSIWVFHEPALSNKLINNLMHFPHVSLLPSHCPIWPDISIKLQIKPPNN
jgi:hypothetical protein